MHDLVMIKLCSSIWMILNFLITIIIDKNAVKVDPSQLYL